MNRHPARCGCDQRVAHEGARGVAVEQVIAQLQGLLRLVDQGEQRFQAVSSAGIEGKSVILRCDGERRRIAVIRRAGVGRRSGGQGGVHDPRYSVNGRRVQPLLRWPHPDRRQPIQPNLHLRHR